MASVRMTPDVKKKIVTEFSNRKLDKSDQKITEEVSLNHDTIADTQALLSGDADEELR